MLHPRYVSVAALTVACSLAGTGVGCGPETERTDEGFARLYVTVGDAETGRPTAARLRLVNEDGAAVLPPDAGVGVMFGRWDRAEGYAGQPDTAFYVPGAFDADLPPGRYRLSISKGIEYLAQEHELVLEGGRRASRTYLLQRWSDMPHAGWYSADDHIHIRRSPRENPFILTWIAAEDIHVGALLQMGDFWATYYAQYAWGEDGTYQVEDHLLTSGQEEPRTHELGHTISLGAGDFVRARPGYYLYDGVFDRVHELGGITGYAHQGVLFHGHLGMTLDVLRRKVDFLELLQFCAPDGPLHLDHYYHFLNLGFPLTATAGSDFPWCGVGEGWNARIGNARFYTFVGAGEGDLSFETWRESLRKGHTFVTSGPMLDLRVNGRIPGDRLDVAAGSAVEVWARAWGHREQVPLEELTVVGHGKVLAAARAGEDGGTREHLELEIALPLKHGMWIAARARAGPAQLAHTTPVYVRVDGGGFHDPGAAPQLLDLTESYLDELAELLATQPHDRVGLHAWRFREEIEKRIAETRAVVTGLRTELR